MYLVEFYSTSTARDSAAFARLCRGTPIHYVRSILIPGDETCLHLVVADSTEQVGETLQRIGLDADRVVSAQALPRSESRRESD